MKKNMMLVVSSTAFAALLLAGCGNSTTQSEQGSVVPQTDTAASVVNTADYIGEDKAKEIALNDAGKDEKDVTDLQVYLDEDQEGNDPAAYDVEFFVGNDEYDYEINASTGDIISQDIDTADESTSQNETSIRTSEGYITKAKAKKIALSDAGLKSSQVSGMHVVLDLDDDREGEPAVYDVEFYSGTTEYDYEIDATTGDIYSKDQDAEGISSSDMTASKEDLISASKAQNKALKHAGFQKNDVTALYAELDSDDGTFVYDVEFYHGGKEYSYEINAVSGEIISHESEYDD